MYRSLKIILIIVGISIFTFSACDNKKESAIRNEVISDNNITEIITKIKNDKDITKEEIDLITAAFTRYVNTPDSLKGKKIGDLIDQQSERRRKTSLNSLVTTSIGLFHQFGFIGWEPSAKDLDTFNVFKFVIHNKSKKDIKEVQGLLKFVTSGNQLIRAFPVIVNQEIKAEKNQPFQSVYKLDKNSKSDVLLHQLLKNKTPNVIPMWQATKIVFADGSEIVVPGFDKKKGEQGEKEEEHNEKQ